MVNLIIKSTLFIAYVSLLVSLVSTSQSDPSTDGFTTDLIHRDSPQSPTYDPSLSPSQRLVSAIRRSVHRIQQFNTKHAQRSPRSHITNSGGEYLMKYSIGTPPVPSLGIADTGSDIIWTQCQPCLQCFNQNLTFFAPKNSSTYKRIPCSTPTCGSLVVTSCSRRRNNCLYYETYGDGSFTHGLLATETLTLPSTSGKRVISLPSIKFGCGFRNGGIFDGGESGIVGLGGGHMSLIRQLGSLAQGKFSYCLVPSSSGGSNSSKLNFGAKAVVSGKKVVSTPLVRKEPDTYYFLTLEGISVGKKKMLDSYDDEPDNEGSRGEGNIIIDSGTTLTLLPFNLYGKLVKELNGSISLERIQDPEGFLELCYFRREGDDIKHPPVTFHFRGADVKLKGENIFIRTSNVSLCLAAQPVLMGFGIYGNLAQINFMVGYDLEKRTVSFRPTHCAKI